MKFKSVLATYCLVFCLACCVVATGCDDSTPPTPITYRIELIRPDGSVDQKYTLTTNDCLDIKADWGGALRLSSWDRSRFTKILIAPVGWNINYYDVEKPPKPLP